MKGGEKGSAPAEFVLVGALLVALVLGVIHIALTAHVRHHLTMAAAEGARMASALDITESEALAHTTDLVGASLGEGVVRDVSIHSSSVNGIPTAVVTITGSIPGLGFLSRASQIRVEAQAPIFVIP